MNSPIPTAPVSPAKVAAPVAQMLALDQVVADPNQPRKLFNEDSLKDLANSIRTEGILSPILVRPNGKGFHIIDGERRFRAAKLAGLKEVPVLVRADLKDQNVTAHQLVANLQREDLTLSEQCDAVAALVKSLNGPDGKGGQVRAAEKLGKSESWVSKRAAHVTHPAEVRALVAKGQVVDLEVAAGIAEFMQVIPDKEQQKELLERARNPDDWGEPLTRDDIRNEIRWAKDAIKSKEEAAKKAAKTRADRAAGKIPAANDHYAKEQAQKAERNRRWKLLNPAMKKFAELAGSVVGAGVELPHHNEYWPDAPPASVAAAKFTLRARGAAEQIQKLVSKTGLALKLEPLSNLPEVTVDQARKIEQVLGKPLQWLDTVSLAGDQIAKLAAKCGKAVAIPEVDLSAPKPAAATTTKAPAKKPAKKKR